MSTLIFNIVLALHIISGSIGLLTGTIAMVANKKQKLHKKVGVVFFYAMAGVFTSSLYMSIAKNNWFLLLIGFFSFYLAATGYRILFLKKLGVVKIAPKAIDYFIASMGFFAAITLLIATFFLLKHGNMFGVVSFNFGCISFWLAYSDLKKFKVPPTNKMHWIASHGMRMAGAYTATVTAFIVVNIQIQQGWILWLLPAAIIIPIAKRIVKNFLKPKQKNTSFKVLAN
jgi:uncharacterized membrane protein